MRVLFISSGNSKRDISPIINNQGKSLNDLGVNVYYYTITHKGLFGYLRHVFKLKAFIRNNNFDIYHAHYSLSGYTAWLAGCKPLVVSLMGSDVKSAGISIYLTKFLVKFFWKKTIVKSEDMKITLNVKSVLVIPNGVDFHKFIPIPKNIAINFLNWDINKKHILFAASKNRPEKNYQLFEEAIQLLKLENICIHTLEDIDNNIMPYYLNASDVVVLTSKHEGSPNVIKEALACERPVVSTEVGDVPKLISKINGCFLSAAEPISLATNIESALIHNKIISRDSIAYLDSAKIAKSIIDIYKGIV